MTYIYNIYKAVLNFSFYVKQYIFVKKARTIYFYIYMYKTVYITVYNINIYILTVIYI